RPYSTQRSPAFVLNACGRPEDQAGLEASTTARAAMLTTPREGTDGDRICAGIAAPSRIGPICRPSVIVLITPSVMLAASRFGKTSRLASPDRVESGMTR